ncbi:methionine--tRNA ligase [Candidatus Microgenomates bacterium]|jgi:methionyl-tRNA synthetase|nr:MAG: methionine--tRNA ligase [Candidatus Microgenomates bacterium]
MSKKFYITSAIPFVNASPHIGFALEIVQTDTLARQHRLLNEEVYFLTGADENSLKNVQAANLLNLPVKELVDKNAAKFKELKGALNLTFDDFIKTSEERHVQGVQALWKACKKEDIYKKKYQGLYCMGCEAFLTEKDLVDGKCPEHLIEPEVVEEENYFFRLSGYQDWLLELISSDKLKITPNKRKNEVISFIKSGLEDFSISRSKERARNWGIPVPGDSDQIIYVWFDALANYITALDWQKNGELFKKFWPADVHVIGKGISRFHAIYWPAMLKSAGLETPKEIFIHSYVTVEGQKISKSLGNVVDPYEVVKKYGTDPVRYYLLKEIPPFNDGDFSQKRFLEVYHADLANGLGNLVSRIARLCEKSELKFPEQKSITLDSKVNTQLADFRFNEALETIWHKVTKENKRINEEKPWQMEKSDLQNFLLQSVETIREIAGNLRPFLPETAEKILKQFKGPEIKPEAVLFPRLENEK